jgi:hypothetical protein
MLSEQTKFCAKGDKYNLNVNIIFKIGQSETRTACGCHVC